jgi:FkbM family methyltransferase
MRLSRDDFSDGQYYFDDVDHAFVRDVGRLVHPNECAIDLGAQKGFFAMLLARAVGPRGLVLAVEPDPRAAALLEEHRERNALSWIRVERVAVGERDGIVELALSTQLGWTSRFPNSRQLRHVESRATVPLRSVDSLVAERLPEANQTAIAMVKLDLEGSEIAALEGMRETIARHAPMLWLEVSYPSLAAAGTSVAALDERLASLGYTIFAPEWNEPLLRRRRIWYRQVPDIAAYRGGGEQFDVLCVSRRYLNRVALLLR